MNYQLWFLGLIGFCAGNCQSIGQPSLHTILSNGPAPNRINLVILSEGYTVSQLPQFLTDATNLVNGLLSEQPYREYRSYFNAFGIAVASAESGSDHPSQGYFRDTYFNSTFDSYGIASFVTIPPNEVDAEDGHGQGRVDSLVRQFLPACDFSLLLVNDLLYGGSGGDLLIASKSVSSQDIVLHESGHSLAGLGDEYSDPYPGFPEVEEPNTTTDSRRECVKWKAWIAQDTPVPTPAISRYADVIGLFEGAHYYTTNWYRPKIDCKMRTLGVPFCEICREALVESIYRKVSPIDAFYPNSTNLTVACSQSLTFSIMSTRPATHEMSFQWFTNDSRVWSSSSDTLTLPAWALGPGHHTVQATATDATPWVRNDPHKLLQRSIRWILDVKPPGLCPPSIDLTNKPGDYFSFLVLGAGFDCFIIEASTNLVNWQPLATDCLTGGRCVFSDTNATRFPWRFYRILLAP